MSDMATHPSSDLVPSDVNDLLKKRSRRPTLADNLPAEIKFKLNEISNLMEVVA